MISENDVKYVAGLSRIHLQDKDIHKFTKELEAILKYIDKLEELDVSNVEPTSHALPLNNVFREDMEKPSLEQESALKISVEKHNGSFKVPKVIE